jgi:hypothetical protein
LDKKDEMRICGSGTLKSFLLEHVKV